MIEQNKFEKVWKRLNMYDWSKQVWACLNKFEQNRAVLNKFEQVLKSLNNFEQIENFEQVWTDFNSLNNLEQVWTS